SAPRSSLSRASGVTSSSSTARAVVRTSLTLLNTSSFVMGMMASLFKGVWNSKSVQRRHGRALGENLPPIFLGGKGDGVNFIHGGIGVSKVEMREFEACLDRGGVASTRTVVDGAFDFEVAAGRGDLNRIGGDRQGLPRCDKCSVSHAARFLEYDQ